MTTFTWSSTASGAWTSPLFWLVAGLPTANTPGGLLGDYDSAIVAAAGTISVLTPAYPDIVGIDITDPAGHLIVQSGLADELTLHNAGTITLTANAVMNAGNLGEPSFGAFSNTGVIDLGPGSQFTLFAPTVTAAIGTVAFNGGTLIIGGSLDNTGATLAASAFPNLTLSGFITGGILRNDGPGLRIANQIPSGDGYGSTVAFTSVTFQGPLAPLGPMSISNGFTLEPLIAGQRPTIDLTGTLHIQWLPDQHGQIIFLDTETLDNATVLLGDLQSSTTLTLGAGATLYNAGTGFLGGRGDFISSATIANTGSLSINNLGTFTNLGTLSSTGGTITDDAGGTLVNTGTIHLAGGHFVGNATGTGAIELSNAATAELTGAYGAQLFRFTTASSLLRLDQVSGTSVMQGFTEGDTIELIGAAATVDFTNGTLDVGNGNLSLAHFVMPGQPSDVQFFATTDASANTFITETHACFASGTRIATTRGDVSVEDLRMGDTVRLAAGGTAPVIWIGHRRTRCRRHPRPWDVQPIRVQADAFAPGRPARDLRLSPDHAIYHAGVLIPVRALVNGRTISQEAVDEVTYWHVELPAHAVLLAENLPCESFLDTGNRAAFANGGPAIALHPDFARAVWIARGCAELSLDGPLRDAAHAYLLGRAATLGHALTGDAAPRLRAGRRALRPTITGQTWQFRLPRDSTSLRLASRTWIPAHMRSHETDTRRLGLAIANLRFDGRHVALSDPRLSSGWHATEPDWRWTDGDAGFALAGIREVSFDIALTGTYWQDGTPDGASLTPNRTLRHAAARRN